MALVVETHRERHLGSREAGGEQATRALQSELRLVRIWGEPGGRLEGPQKGKRGETHLLGQVSQGQRDAVQRAGLKELLCSPHRPRLASCGHRTAALLRVSPR